MLILTSDHSSSLFADATSLLSHVISRDEQTVRRLPDDSKTPGTNDLKCSAGPPDKRHRKKASARFARGNVTYRKKPKFSDNSDVGIIPAGDWLTEWLTGGRKYSADIIITQARTAHARKPCSGEPLEYDYYCYCGMYVGARRCPLVAERVCDWSCPSVRLVSK